MKVGEKLDLLSNGLSSGWRKKAEQRNERRLRFDDLLLKCGCHLCKP